MTWVLLGMVVGVNSNCQSDGHGSGTGGGSSGSTTDMPGSITDTPGSTGTTTATTQGGSDGDSTGTKFDVGVAGTGGPTSGGGGQPSCKVEDDMNAPGACDTKAPPGSFEPEIQWSWAGGPDEHQSIVTPLVANFNDDNGDGAIDLCDIPDVVVVAYGTIYTGGHIYLLDGATGAVHLQVATLVQERITPAIGDIDNDGLVEIVTLTYGEGADLVAFEHDGAEKWRKSAPWLGNSGPAIALADLDHDGDVEIIAGVAVADHEGNTLWTSNDDVFYYAATTAADLDGDDDLEVIVGATAYHHDGSRYYSASIGHGFPQVADLDADEDPEIMVVGYDGVSVLEHDGTVKYTGVSPTGAALPAWDRPATVHDFDGDGLAEAAASSASRYSVFEADGSLVWTAAVLDASGIAAGTAFDFLGDGVAEAMYADESTLFVFDGAGEALLSIPRTSWTTTEYPVVVDVDNDGSAEIVVVSGEKGGPPSPTVQVIRDVEDRWIQARRIWNQHTYHVSNVREDGTIPQFEPKHWKLLNTFRTNAQIEGGGVCKPVPEG